MVTLKIYNVLGQVVATLADEAQEAGIKSANFDGSNLTSGVYYYRLQTNKLIFVRKMMVNK